MMLIFFQVVLADGDIVKTGSRARKSAAGCVSSLCVKYQPHFCSLNPCFTTQINLISLIFTNYVGMILHV